MLRIGHPSHLYLSKRQLELCNFLPMQGILGQRGPISPGYGLGGVQ